MAVGSTLQSTIREGAPKLYIIGEVVELDNGRGSIGRLSQEYTMFTFRTFYHYYYFAKK
jgi:hypothetical protein